MATHVPPPPELMGFLRSVSEPRGWAAPAPAAPPTPVPPLAAVQPLSRTYGPPVVPSSPGQSGPPPSDALPLDPTSWWKVAGVLAAAVCVLFLIASDLAPPALAPGAPAPSARPCQWPRPAGTP